MKRYVILHKHLNKLDSEQKNVTLTKIINL